ncbi:hypothetical protein [Paenibacillus mendelii]|uniref:DUF3153 domain-containing protein n=1 Tax=Paenibacillus mendelii TaxID=206163 RepID=A0ABV6J659_9BACL|nr:hypothetical protein [Paenibacillus mendelii]MCQ6559417.1 hypothetical protein [Paenibacillus mendelii]
MKQRLFAVSVLLFALFLLAGCAKGTAHVTIHMDGSIEVAATIRLDSRAQKLVGTKAEEAIESKSSEYGYRYKKEVHAEAVEYQIQRTFSSIDELKATFGNWDGKDLVVEKKSGFLSTRYVITGQVDTGLNADRLLRYIGDLNVSERLVKLFLTQLTFDFKLTLPINTIGDHNADEEEGRTLTWTIPLTSPKPVLLEVYVPNVSAILVVGGSGIVLITAAVLLIIRRKRRKSV